jgi:membrane-associated phospholipid phosphatase
VHVLVSRTTDFSLPSDHATMAGAVAAGLFLANRRWGTIAAAAALLMAFTRVYVGAHYLSDVLAGLALGAAVAVIGWWAVVPLLDRLVARLARTPLRPLITAATEA